jgi:hypothetical protein
VSGILGGRVGGTTLILMPYVVSGSMYCDLVKEENTVIC